VNGVLVVDKPSGPTSHDVVARTRRLLGVKRVGHTGTLDPLASGVLPLVVGRATRLARFLSGGEKCYDAGVRLGRSTNTYDALGTFGEPAGPVDQLTHETVERALDEFRGTVWQSPPPYSAKKIGGVRAYVLARAAKPAEPQPTQVAVHRLSIEAYGGGAVRLRIVCSAGFYVRSLAHDLGSRLGCGGYLETLRRTASGGFDLADAIPFATLEAEPARGLEAFVQMDHLLTHLPAAVLSSRGSERAAHGNTVSGSDIVQRLPGLEGTAAPADTPVRLLDEAGSLLAIARPGPGPLLHPMVVLI
jgi:tRNA pseudouridine55 synthase